MAKKGKLTTSKAQKAQHTAYLAGNRVEKNKLRKLIRHCMHFPRDKENAENLERIRNKGFKYTRAKPRNPGINKDTQKSPAYRIQVGHVFGPETAGEQLSRLLGIPLKTPRYTNKPKKTAVRYKKTKNVKT